MLSKRESGIGLTRYGCLCFLGGARYQWSPCCSRFRRQKGSTPLRKRVGAGGIPEVVNSLSGIPLTCRRLQWDGSPTQGVNGSRTA